jgi:hypothetical protein
MRRNFRCLTVNLPPAARKLGSPPRLDHRPPDEGVRDGATHPIARPRAKRPCQRGDAMSTPACRTYLKEFAWSYEELRFG